LVREQQDLTGKFFQAELSALRQGISLGQNHPEAFMKEAFGIQVGRIDRGPKNTNIDLTFPQGPILHRSEDDVLVLNVNFGELPGEFGHEASDALGERYANSDLQAAALSFASPVHRFCELSCLRHQSFGFVQDQAAGISQVHLLSVPDKQRNPQFLLQLTDLPADRGLRDVEPLSGFAEIQSLRHGNEILQLAKLHEVAS
jgi:hypothetical protein